MPGGREHELFNTALLCLQAGLFPETSARVGQEAALMELFGFAVGSYLVTPDLDLAERQRVRPLKRWGPFAWIWWPYGLLFKHRGLSHHWLLGPLSRLGYLLLIGAAFGFLRGVDLGAWASAHPRGLAGFILGYVLAEWSHLLLDRFVKGRKRTRRRRARG